ncbi:hypothetical protein QF023_000927 [Chryseobacterium sp. SLBN-27]|nr:hypothetical protein [Chryseobacterium sp. SLBN-27]
MEFSVLKNVRKFRIQFLKKLFSKKLMSKELPMGMKNKTGEISPVS